LVLKRVKIYLLKRRDKKGSLYSKKNLNQN